MSDRKKWGLAAVVTGVVCAVVGLVVFFTTTTPGWLILVLGIVEFVAGSLGFGLLYKPEPPA